jgi:hypothetical protein
MEIRAARPGDAPLIWAILEPIIRAGETYALPRDMAQAEAIANWIGPDRVTFVAEEGGRVFGIVSLHLKDRTADGQNLPWGEGGTPIKEVLRLMTEEKWSFPGDIEVEYKIPPASSAVAEVAKCVRYCREALA